MTLNSTILNITLQDFFLYFFCIFKKNSQDTTHIYACIYVYKYMYTYT